MAHSFKARTGMAAAVVLAGVALFASAAAGIAVADPIVGKMDQPLRDPWVPPELRKPSGGTPTQGPALRAQVERKLKAAFDAADVSRSGSLTRQQATDAGLGFVARHFEQIDRQRAGTVRFDDIKRYLIEQGAKLD